MTSSALIPLVSSCFLWTCIVPPIGEVLVREWYSPWHCTRGMEFDLDRVRDRKCVAAIGNGYNNRGMCCFD